MAVHHAGHAQALAGHFQQRFAQVGFLADLRDGGAGVHDVAHVQQQTPAETPGWMGACEVLAREAARLEQRDCQGIADGKRGRGARGRCQVMRARFFFNPGIENGIGLSGEAGVGIAEQGDEFHAHALDDWQDGENFRGLAGIGNGEHDVDGHNHAEIAV